MYLKTEGVQLSILNVFNLYPLPNQYSILSFITFLAQ
jgi:hypothetical protein